MTGWIKISRDIQNHWIWKDPIKLKWWIDILITVNHADTKVNLGFELYECKRGQSIMSLKNWAERWCVSKDSTRNFFTLLEKDGMIIHENLSKSTRITVCNYDTYQNNLHDEQTQSKRKANDEQTQSGTNKKEKNVKETKENNTHFTFDEFWQMYAKSRDKKLCQDKYEKISEDDREKIKLTLPDYISSTPDVKFRKDPIRYLKNEVWNDIQMPTDIKARTSTDFGADGLFDLSKVFNQ